jgi:putative DNA primase/helicase
VRRLVRDFLTDVACPESERDAWIDVYFEQRDPDWPVTQAMLVPTGGGKTRITIQELATWISEVAIRRPIIYAVPLHKLSPEIEKQFADAGINARIFRGRNAEDPENPGRNTCINPKAVALATKCHADITTSCCFQSKEKKCWFYDPGPGQCGYQRQQLDAETVQVWIVASDMLFQTHKVFAEPVAVILDESIWRKGIRGLEIEEHETRWLISINSLLHNGPLDFNNPIDTRDSFRDELGEALQNQEKLGSVERQHLFDALNVKKCSEVIALEWKCLPKLELEPGMSDAEIAALEANEILIDTIRHNRRVIRIWEAVRELLRHPEIAVSGRLILKQQNGQRVVEWRGVADISKQFWVSTLMLDATRPTLPILQVYHPQAEIVADIKCAMPPHVRIKQVLGAPTSSNKLHDEKHLSAVRRYILRRWMETGRQRTLVITQLYADEWLKVKGLPKNIAVEHFNNITGRDEYHDVRLLLVIGRTAPGPRATEALAGALSGAQPKIVPFNPRFTWYPSSSHSIKLRDGSGIKTNCDEHPDRFVEDVRWLVHEAELIQSIGRGRALNRTAETPLDIDLLFDTCLPIAVDEAVRWKKPSLLIETAIDEGAVLTSPIDMVKAWPALWPNEKAADRCLRLGVLELPGFEPVHYQLAGPKMNRRLAYFDRRIIADPRAWLRKRLGPLV